MLNQETRKSLNKKALAIILVVIWAGVIFSFSEIETTQTSKIHWQDFIVKKSAHIIEFGILTILTYRTARIFGKSAIKSAYYSVFFSFLYGMSDEFHQRFTPGRGPSIRDVGFDTVGAILAIILIWKLLPKAPMRLKALAEKWHLD